MLNLKYIGENSKKASRILNNYGEKDKNRGLTQVAHGLLQHQKTIQNANQKDIMIAREHGMSEALLDRLTLTRERIEQMAQGLLDIVTLKDPVGEVISMSNRPNGLTIGQKRVPIGVVGIIYESRPNVTVDAFGLCFKTGNAVILRGGSDAIHSNKAIVHVIQLALEESGLPKEAVQLIEDTSRETVIELMGLNQFIDVLIPRGGAGLIRSVVEHSKIPVIETGTGNCHTYVDEYADLDMALSIIVNAKTQRYGVCNACESLVIHQKIMNTFIPLLYNILSEKGVIIRSDVRGREICNLMESATEEDFGKEYLDSIISLKVVDTIEEAIEHINRYNTKHSEAIITKDYQNAMKFLNEIDAAAVYVNASTRFTDGGEFGFGAEIGISTQKLHARGPMGLVALTTTKYIIFGDGHIRS